MIDRPPSSAHHPPTPAPAPASTLPAGKAMPLPGQTRARTPHERGFAGLVEAASPDHDDISAGAPATRPHATGFAETGVFGLTEPVTFASLSLRRNPTATADASPQTDLAASTPPKPAQASLTTASKMPPPEPTGPSAGVAGRAQTSTLTDSGQAAYGAPTLSTTAHVDDVHHTPSSVVRRSGMAALRASAISVALHASDRGLRIIARVGRMSRTELQRLRQSMRVLLSEHGVGDAEIQIAALIAEDEHHG